MPHDRRLIEDSMPLEAISVESSREKSIRRGHISTLHIWWARRPLAAMRAAIFASLIPAPKDNAERAYLHDLITRMVDWDAVKDGNSAAIEEARALIKKCYPDAPPKVLDPFMGGGSTGFEALRLGCDAHGVELNPVACLIDLCALVYPQKYGQPVKVVPKNMLAEQSEFRGMETLKQMTLDFDGEPYVIQNPLAEAVRKWGTWVLEEARKVIGHLYEDPEGGTILGYLWARTAKCPNPACGSEMPTVHQLWLAKTDRRKVAIRLVVNEITREISFDIAEGNEIDFDPEKGTMKRSTILCPMCGTAPGNDYLREEGQAGRLGAIPMAVVYEQEASGKGYRAVTNKDRALFQESIEMLQGVLAGDPDALPDEQLPYLRSIFNVNVYGMEKWADLFNARQALALITLTTKVREAYKRMCDVYGDSEFAKVVTTYLGLTLDRFADRNSSICIWDYLSEGPVNTFKLQALPMVWDYVEIAMGTGGPGDWSLGSEWIASLCEVAARISSTGATLHPGTATHLPYDRETFEAILTDPPYYDAVPYADLSDFFYVWLKRAIGDLYPEMFSTPLTPKTSEIVQLAERNQLYAQKDKAFYEEQLTKAFADAQRVLKANGVFVVVFAHKSTSAWETLINSLLHSGLIVSASWPLHTERPGRMRAQDSAALASSIFIVCRKRIATSEGIFDDVHAELRSRIGERLDFFWSQGIRGADFFISAIGPAVEVFGRFKTVRKLSGEVVSVSDLLTLIQEAVADYALGKVLNGRYRMGTVDAPTRFYVMYRWSYGKEKLPFDDARRLAQALGAEVDELIHRLKLLKQSGEDVDLFGPLQREKVDRLGERGRDSSDAPLIDLVHRAALLWRSGDRVALANYLTTHAMGREDALRAVAQALINVLPEGDKERQLLEGFLSGQENLPPADVGRDVRLPGME